MARHILLISRCPPYPLHFGDRLILWHLARELSGRGYTLDLIALTQRPSDQDDIGQYAHFFRSVTLFPEITRTQPMYLRRLLGQHHPHDRESAWQKSMWAAIEQHLSDNSYDIVHLFGGVHIYEFAHLVRELPTIITPYESYSLYLKRTLEQQFTPQQWLARQITRQFERWMFAPYDYTVVLAEEDRQELLGINPALQVGVIPNGIDLQDFEHRDSERDDASVLFVGNYEYPPNHDAALLLLTEIFPDIAQAIPDAKLFLVGNAPSDEMLAYASENVVITGRVPRVQDYLASATVFVCPLRAGAGIKNKVLEALAMGIPTVATPLSVDGITVQHGSHAQITPVETIADVTIELIRNPALQNTLSKNAPQLIAERYSWQGVVNQYERLYGEITKKL